ncbi:MAG: MBL fold metallo-hydrolase [Anaerovoracaceae bacterium]
MKITNLPSGPLAVNTYLVVDETTNKGFIVDPGGHNTKLTQMVNSENIDIEYIILTHGHGDHTGGVKQHMQDFPNAKLAASIEEKAMLADADMNMSTMVFSVPITFVEADLWVKNGDTLKIGNMELKFIHTPGHSPGGMCILVDNVLFSGDTLFCQSVGRTDFPGCSFDDLKESIHKKLFVLPDDTKVFPGHMGTTSIGFEKRNNPFV